VKYNIAYVIGNYFDLFGDAVGMAVGPYYTKLFTKGDVESEHSIKEITYFLQITFISLSFFVSLWFREIFHFLIKNNELNNVYPIAIIIVMGYAYRPMYWASVNKLFFLEKTKQLWKISFLGGVINVVLNLIFINIYGYKAAAITTLISLLFIGFSGFYIREFKENNNINFNPMMWLLLILISTIMVYFLRDIALLYKSIISLFIIITYFIYIMSKIKTFKKIEI
jgi:O-antigen/teichoic acid export membrane protein